MEDYIEELSAHNELITKILEENNGEIGITKLIGLLKKHINTKTVVCRDAIMTAGAKGVIKIAKKPTNQLMIETS